LRLEVLDELWVGSRRIWVCAGCPRELGGRATMTRRYVVEGVPGRVFDTIVRARFAAGAAGPVEPRR
jgi:hypothetical protein